MSGDGRPRQGGIRLTKMTEQTGKFVRQIEIALSRARAGGIEETKATISASGTTTAKMTAEKAEFLNNGAERRQHMRRLLLLQVFATLGCIITLFVKLFGSGVRLTDDVQLVFVGEASTVRWQMRWALVALGILYCGVRTLAVLNFRRYQRLVARGDRVALRELHLLALALRGGQPLVLLVLR